MSITSAISLSIFNVFRERLVIEKYVGPIDDKNFARNVDFINPLARA